MLYFSTILVHEQPAGKSARVEKVGGFGSREGGILPVRLAEIDLVNRRSLPSHSYARLCAS